MYYWGIILLVSSYSSLLLAAVLTEPELNELGGPYTIAGKPVSQSSYLSWLRQMIAEPRHQMELQEQKRFTDFQMPYMKYKVDKRNKGVWIWMPAQGYVSVPQQQEEGENALGKPGKIMRYG